MDSAQTKPLGGYVLIPARALIASWWAYKRGFIVFRDLRVWFATFEAVARRCGASKGRVPRYTVTEIHSLVGGVGGEHVRNSLRRLERAGLIAWSERAIRHGGHEGLRVGDAAELDEAIDAVTNNRRRVPVPRRVLRFLALTGRPVTVATVLGHLFRCVYFRNGKFAPKGLCKASWIADVFEVDERNAKRAREELVKAGLLIREATPQMVMNRWGVSVRLNLEWGGARPTVRSESPPPAAQSTTETPPPRRTGNSLARSEYQKPGGPAPDGVRIRTKRGPSLRHVEPSDLHSPKQLLVLAQSWAVSRKRRLSEHDVIRVLATAQHAVRVGRKNPCGLFATILRRELWEYLSNQDEDAGRLCLREWRSRVTASDAAANRDRVQAIIRSTAAVTGVMRQGVSTPTPTGQTAIERGDWSRSASLSRSRLLPTARQP